MARSRLADGVPVTVDDEYPPGWAFGGDPPRPRHPAADDRGPYGPDVVDADLDGPTEKWGAPLPRRPVPPKPGPDQPEPTRFDAGPDLAGTQPDTDPTRRISVAHDRTDAQAHRPYVGDLPAPHLLRDRWARIVIDRPGPDVEPRPTTSGSYRPDTIFDGWSTDDFTLRLASVRGRRHRSRGVPRQDDVAATVHSPSGSIVFAVADGASAAEHSHVGAAVACRSAVAGAIAELDHRGAIDWPSVFERTAANLISRTGRILGTDRPDAARAAGMLATTLVAGVLTPTANLPRLSLAYVGDPAAWLLRRHRYERLTLPGAADAPLPHLPARVARVDRSIPADAVLLAGTVGFGGPLGDGRGHVGELFAWLFGMSPTALALAHVLDFAQEAYDEDRTLLAISPNRSRTRPMDHHRRGSDWSAWQSG